MTPEHSPGQVRDTGQRSVWIIGGVLALASLAAAAGIGLRSAALPSSAVPPAVASTQDSLAPGETLETERRGTPVPALGAAKPAAPARTARADSPAPLTTARVADVCRDCGVVESVQAVTRKGEGTGVGAVAGGVVGALLGNQVGKGNGRKAMTVIGAVGGGAAGHEIEKRSRSTTIYRVQVRMEDGSLRTIEQANSPSIGARVIVQGQSLRPAGAPRAAREPAGTAV